MSESVFHPVQEKSHSEVICTTLIPYLSLTYTFSVCRILSSLSHHFPISWRLLRCHCSAWWLLDCLSPALFHLPFETREWQVAESQSYTWRGQHHSRIGTGFLQHLGGIGPASGALPDSGPIPHQVLQALTNTDSLCGQHHRCAGTSALVAPVSPWQLYTNHPAPAH